MVTHEKSNIAVEIKSITHIQESKMAAQRNYINICLLDAS